MATKPEGEQFVEAFVDARRFQFEREVAREALRRNALEANLFSTGTLDLNFEERIGAITDELDAFNAQRAAELSGLVEGRLITVRNISPSGMYSPIEPIGIRLDPRRRPQTITGSEVKIMDDVKGFTALSAHPIHEPPTETESMESAVEPATSFQVRDVTYSNLGTRVLLPRISVDIHDA